MTSRHDRFFRCGARIDRHLPWCDSLLLAVSAVLGDPGLDSALAAIGAGAA